VPAPIFFGQLLGNCKEGYFADPQYGGKPRHGSLADGLASLGREPISRTGSTKLAAPIPMVRFHQRCESVMAERKKPADAGHHRLRVDRCHHGQNPDGCRTLGGRA